MKPNWREASSLILAAFKGAAVKSGWNYSLLLLERSKNSSFMPNGHVFPGGVISFEDENNAWFKIFSNFNIGFENSVKIKEIPPILKCDEGLIPKLISLKIAAIRETFEETGVLLCSSNKNQSEKSKEWVSFINIEGIEEWRSKVKKDPSQFLNLCNHINCYPDVNNIHLWSNWLTPTSMGKKRFDTLFFIGFLNEIPIAVPDKEEIERLKWEAPDKLMTLCKNNKVWLPPPQFYEVARILQFQDINSLNEFAMCRSEYGCQRWMPQQFKTLNGTVSLLPGDDAYNITDFNTLTELSKIEITNEEFQSKSEVLHRMEFVNQSETKIVVKNYEPPYGQVLPLDKW